MKALKLKLDTCIDSGLLYYVYQNQGQGPITLEVTSHDRFYKFPFMKNSCHTFSKNCKGNKVETWFTHEKWADVWCIPDSGPKTHNSWS